MKFINTHHLTQSDPDKMPIFELSQLKGMNCYFTAESPLVNTIRGNCVWPNVAGWPKKVWWLKRLIVDLTE